jgi:4'-phosphopantetheinyl transferase
MAAATTIDVWVIHLNAIAADCGAFLDRFLSVREQERAQRYVFARDATRFRVCRAVLRIVLAWYVQDAPERILLETGPCGKPFLGQTSAVHFNVSHSAGLGAIACTTVGEVGIDIELVRQDLASREIALTNFTKKEAALVAAEATRTQALKFFRLWTRKEAVLKAVGCGITQGLDSVDVSQEPPTVVSLNGKAGHPAGPLWLVRDLQRMENFVGAVAAPVGCWSVCQRELRTGDVVRSLVGAGHGRTKS